MSKKTIDYAKELVKLRDNLFSMKKCRIDLDKLVKFIELYTTHDEDCSCDMFKKLFILSYSSVDDIEFALAEYTSKWTSNNELNMKASKLMLKIANDRGVSSYDVVKNFMSDPTFKEAVMIQSHIIILKEFGIFIK